jgi:hypothetical protein
VCASGFEKFADDRLFTVFSASNYCGKKNEGAILEVGFDDLLGTLAATARPHYYNKTTPKRPSTPPRQQRH